MILIKKKSLMCVGLIWLAFCDFDFRPTDWIILSLWWAHSGASFTFDQNFAESGRRYRFALVELNILRNGVAFLFSVRIIV